MMMNNHQFSLTKISPHLFIVVIGFLLTGLYFSPFLADMVINHRVPYRFFLGDEINLYASQFINSYYLFHDHIYQGVDFFTFDGASEYFLRPNIPVNYAIFKVVYALYGGWDVRELLGIYILVIAAHLLACFICSSFLYYEFVRKNTVYAILCGVLTAFAANFLYGKGFSSFVIIVSLVPVAMYFVHRAVLSKPYIHSALAGVIVYLIITGGYLPLAIFSLVVLFSFFILRYYCMAKDFDKVEVGIKFCFIFVLPLLIASPWLMAVIIFNGHANTVLLSYSQAALSMSSLPSDIATSISYGIFPKSSSEIFTRYVGLPLLFLAVFFPFFHTYSFKHHEKTVLIFSLIITFVMYLISLGANSFAPDIFYNVFRLFGSMHIYGRYSELTHIFSVFALMILISKINVRASHYAFKFAFMVGLLILLALLAFEYDDKITFTHGSIQLIIVEVFTFLIVVWVALLLGKRWFIVTLTVVMFLSFGNLFLQPYRGNNIDTVKKHLALDYPKSNSLVLFLKEHSSGKALIKVANFDPEIQSYFDRALPWFIRNRIKVSNYYGYEPHLSRYRGYSRMFPFYGIFDNSWLANTGVDFIIFKNDKAEPFRSFIDTSVKPYRISDTLTMVKVRGIDAGFDAGLYDLSFNFDGNGCLSSLPEINRGKLKVLESCNGHYQAEVNQEYFQNVVSIHFTKGEPLVIRNLLVVPKVAEASDYVIDHFSVNGDFSQVTPDGDGGWYTLKGRESGSINVFRTIRDRHGDWFDNGIIKASNQLGIHGFETNFASSISFETDSKKPHLVYLNLFASPFWNVTINGQGADVQVVAGAMSVLVPAGKNTVNFEYNNTLLMVSRYMQILFIVLVLGGWGSFVIRRIFAKRFTVIM